eukprot:335464-Amphidinium_carterae.1
MKSKSLPPGVLCLDLRIPRSSQYVGYRPLSPCAGFSWRRSTSSLCWASFRWSSSSAALSG